MNNEVHTYSYLKGIHMNDKPITAPVWLGTLKTALDKKDIAWTEDEVTDYDAYYCPEICILADKISAWAERKEFLSPTDFSETQALMAKLMLIVAELGEAAEALRDDDPVNFAEELADTIIRILHLSSSLEIPIDEIIAQKMIVNENRPKKHGRVSGV